MYRLTGIPVADFAIQNRKLILPGDPEPEWLRRNVELARALPALKADRRAMKTIARRAGRKGIVARLRLAFSRA